MSEGVRILEVLDNTGASVSYEMIDDSTLVDHQEIVGARRDLRRARAALEQAGARITAVEERMLAAEARALAAEAKASALEARLLSLEERSWRCEADLALTRVPERHRAHMRRLLFHERPDSIDAWISDTLRSFT